jgi:phosphatidylserine/phosphatidylglycerophosphate/cardiolipin synthase-like enzyme
MRKKNSNNEISVNAIAGTEVVLLGLNAEREAAKGLLGFTIYKKVGKKGKYKPLPGSGRVFEKTHNIHSAKNKNINTEKAPIQAFMWGDYVVNPNTNYTYKVLPVYGKPEALKYGKGLEVSVKTEDPENKKHAVFFNRGVAGSQAYSNKFGKYLRWYNDGESLKDFIKPHDVPKRAAYKWLSRGLEEAMLGFIAQAKDKSYSIRAAVYEFTYIPVIQAFVDAVERGVDVKIIHHAKRETSRTLKYNKDFNVNQVPKKGEGGPKVYNNREVKIEPVKDSVCQAADHSVAQIGLKNPQFKNAFNDMMIERKQTTISHNKFMILFKNGKPVQVWTGSTNYTEGGIFGQSNVGHIIRDAEVAQKYYDYWQKLSTDPKPKSTKKEPPDTGIRNWTVIHQPDLTGPPAPNSITTIFSPRLSKAMLDWYADRLDKAKNSVFFTAAFSVANEIFNKVKVKKNVGADTSYLRYLLLESKSVGKFQDAGSKYKKSKYRAMKKVNQNRIAWGATLEDGPEEKKHHEFIETLTGLNDHVNYLHTKYMLIDPLSDDPIVITGSANFSENSTTKNDENMIIIRGNKRVADIFLGEFMRLFKHFELRNKLHYMSDEEKEKDYYLKPNDSWTKPYYEKGNQLAAERKLFS